VQNAHALILHMLLAGRLIHRQEVRNFLSVSLHISCPLGSYNRCTFPLLCLVRTFPSGFSPISLRRHDFAWFHERSAYISRFDALVGSLDLRTLPACRVLMDLACSSICDV